MSIAIKVIVIAEYWFPDFDEGDFDKIKSVIESQIPDQIENAPSLQFAEFCVQRSHKKIDDIRDREHWGYSGEVYGILATKGEAE